MPEPATARRIFHVSRPAAVQSGYSPSLVQRMGGPGTDTDTGSALDRADTAMDGSASSVDGVPLTSQRRSLTPMKRVESRVPVNDMQDQPLISQAKKLLDDQRAK